MVQINGTPVDTAGKTISAYLAETDYDPARIAIEQNGKIVPKSQYDKTFLSDDDVIEVVSFVGGG